MLLIKILQEIKKIKKIKLRKEVIIKKIKLLKNVPKHVKKEAPHLEGYSAQDAKFYYRIKNNY